MAEFFPPIKDEQLMVVTIVLKKLESNPSYLDDPDCPYSPSVKTFFRDFKAKKLAADPEAMIAPNLFENKDETEVLDKQLQRIISDLDHMQNTLGAADVSDRLALLKAKTSLIEKLIGLRERVYNLRELTDFRNLIIAGLEEICTKDQITQFMKNLDGTLKHE